jgi:hypothetical protein
MQTASAFLSLDSGQFLLPFSLLVAPSVRSTPLQVDNMDFNAYMATTDSDTDGEDSDAGSSDAELSDGAAEPGAENGSAGAPGKLSAEDRKLKKKEKREKERERLRALLLGDGDKKEKGEGGDEDEDEEMEITFNTGLNDLGEKLEQKRREKEQQVRAFLLLFTSW